MAVNIDLLRRSVKIARWVRIGMYDPERLIRSLTAQKEDSVPRARNRARVNLQAARIAQRQSQLRGFVFGKRIGKFVTLQTIQKRGVHQSVPQNSVGQTESLPGFPERPHQRSQGKLPVCPTLWIGVEVFERSGLRPVGA